MRALIVIATLVPVLGFAQEPAPTPRIVKVELNDGQVLHGVLKESGEAGVVLELPSGAAMTLTKAAVKVVVDEPTASVTSTGAVWPRDPNRTRYFYSPSAMMLKQGEVSFSQKELLFSSVGVGVMDWFSVQAGAVLPAYFVGSGQGINFIGAVKVGAPITERIHLAAGAQSVVLPLLGNRPFVAGFAFSTFTYGTPDAHVSLSAGLPFMVNNSTGVSGDLIVTVSANVRVSRNVALVTENWLMPTFGRDFVLVDGVGVRIMGEHVAVDIGGIWLATGRGVVTPVPIPWLDFTWNF